MYPLVASGLPDIDTTAKTPKDMRTKTGTMGYRALEVSVHSCVGVGVDVDGCGWCTAHLFVWACAWWVWA